MKINFAPGFWDSWHKCFGPWGRFKNWCYNNNPYRNFKTMVQRGTRGYSSTEYWCPKEWLGKVIVNNLEHFKDSKRMGYPCRFKDQYEWEKKLDKMIDGWKTLNEWDEIWERVHDRYQKVSKGKTKKFFGTKIKNLTKAERKKMNDELDKRYKEAVKNAKLLPEYFMNLWD